MIKTTSCGTLAKISHLKKKEGKEAASQLCCGSSLNSALARKREIRCQHVSHQELQYPRYSDLVIAPHCSSSALGSSSLVLVIVAMHCSV